MFRTTKHRLRYGLWYGLFILALWPMGLSWWAIFTLLALWGMWMFLFRKGKLYPSPQDISAPPLAILTPINGKVLAIKREVRGDLFGPNYNRLELSNPLHQEGGIYLPISSEIGQFTIKKGPSLLSFGHSKKEREHSSGFLSVDNFTLTLKVNVNVNVNAKSKNIGLQIPKGLLGRWPKLWVFPGDRGRRWANIGHLTLGGKVFLYIPQYYEILVKEADKISVGTTVLAISSELRK